MVGSMDLRIFACIVLSGPRTGTDNIRDYARLYTKDSLYGPELPLGFTGKIFQIIRACLFL
jgi:hypothetical protein